LLPDPHHAHRLRLAQIGRVRQQDVGAVLAHQILPHLLTRLFQGLLLGRVARLGVTLDLPGRVVRSDNSSWEVEGYAKTRDAAEEKALDEACEKVGEYLVRKYGSNILLPDPAYLREAKAMRVVGVRQE